MTAKFGLGQVVATPAALSTAERHSIVLEDLLARHVFR